jgi:hypothetical protein
VIDDIEEGAPLPDGFDPPSLSGWVSREWQALLAKEKW